MGFWSIMNDVAWVLCAVIVIYLVFDVVKVERSSAKKRANGETSADE